MVRGRRRDWARDAAEEWDHIAHPAADRWRLLWENTAFPIHFANWRLLPAAQNRSFNLWDEGRQLDSQDDG